MNTKLGAKFLSVFLCLLMIFSGVGNLAFVKAEDLSSSDNQVYEVPFSFKASSEEGNEIDPPYIEDTQYGDSYSTDSSLLDGSDQLGQQTTFTGLESSTNVEVNDGVITEEYVDEDNSEVDNSQSEEAMVDKVVDNAVVEINDEENNDIFDDGQGDGDILVNDSSSLENNHNLEENYSDVSNSDGTEVTPASWFLFNAETQTITGYSSSPDAPKNVVIPNTINGKEVLHIASEAFAGQMLTSIKFNNNLKTIGANAFYNNLFTTVDIPDSVTSIGDSAFGNCGNLVDFTIGTGIDSGNSVSASNILNGSKNIVNLTIKSGYVGTFASYSNLENVVLPEGITSISDEMFKGCISLTSITIPKSVTSIGSSAFSGCTELASITIPSNVTSIGSSAFSGCSSLASITIPESVTSIGSSAFENCTSLTSVIFPNITGENVLTLGSSTFSGCTSLQSVVLIQGIKALPSNIFAGCTSLTSVTLNSDLESIGEEAFLGCTKLANITIPSNVTSIGSSAFSGCIALNLITLNDGLESIGEEAFLGCTKLASITIPSNVTSIGSSAFSGCSSLASITIPRSVTSIGSSAFKNCSSLTSVTLPEMIEGNVLTLGSSTFSGCTSLQSVTLNQGIKALPSNIFAGCTSLTSVKLNTDLESIGVNAFSGCNALVEIEIPALVKSIDSNAFTSTSSLKKIIISKESESIAGSRWGATNDVLVYWSDTIEVDSYVYTIGTKTIDRYVGNESSATVPSSFTYDGKTYEVDNIGEYAFYGNSTLTELTISEGIENLDSYSFANMKGLNSISLPNSLTVIGSYAFSGSTLQAVTIPGSVKTIGEYSFEECHNLESVTFASGSAQSTSIGGYAFYNCKNLETVSINNNLTSIGNSAFNSCKSLASISLPSSVTSIGDNAFNGCTALHTVVLNEGLKTIGRTAFNNCNALTSISIPSSVSDLGESAFKGCSSLESAVFDENIQLNTISANIFNGCSKLNNVKIPDSVETIGDNAFSNCTSLSAISIPSSVVTIGVSAFSGCSKMISLTFSDNSKLESIGNSAFYNCALSGSVILPSGLITIGSSVFNGCGNLQSVSIPSTVNTIGESVFSNCNSLETIFIDKTEDSVEGAKWGAPDKTVVYWQGIVRIDPYMFSLETGTILQYIGTQETELNIPNTLTYQGVEYEVEEIAQNAFSNATNLTSVSIPDSVTSIGASAFTNCENLLSIKLPAGLTTINDNTFNNCYRLESIEIPDTVTSIGSSAFYNCDALVAVSIPDSVLTIGANAFKDCYNLNIVEIGNGITSIGSEVFKNCNKLTSIFIDKEENSISGYGSKWGAGSSTTVYWESYIIVEPYIINIETGTIVKYIGTGVSELTIPSHVEHNGQSYEIREIGASAFHTNTELEKIVIPDTVISIGNYAFFKNSKLRDLQLSKNLISIGNYAFSGCSSLVQIVFPNSLETINQYAFKDCTSLTSIDIPDSVTSLGNGAFQSNTNLKEITIGSGVENLNNYTGGSSVGPFRYCSNIEKMTLNCKYIGYFTGLIKLKEVNLGDNVKALNTKAFYGATALESIVLPDNLTSIWIEAFSGCTSLKNVEFGENVEIIKESAFANCSSLEHVILSDSIKTVETKAFLNCTNLKSIIFGDGIETIESAAFSGCTNLELILIPKIRESFSPAVNQPWGTPNTTVKVKYLGEYVTFNHEIEVVYGEYARNILINAFIEDGTINTIKLPDGTSISVGGKQWPTVNDVNNGKYAYKVTVDGIYTFIGTDSSGLEVVYEVYVKDIGKPTLSALEEIYVTEKELASIDSNTIVQKSDAIASTIEKGNNSTDVALTVGDEDVNNVKALSTSGDYVIVTIVATSPTGLTDTKQVKVILKEDSAPVLNVPEVLEFNVGELFDPKDPNIITGLSVSDEEDDLGLDDLEITESVPREGKFLWFFSTENTNRLTEAGTYEVIYTITDSVNNTVTKEMKVKVHGLPYFTETNEKNIYNDTASTVYLRARQSGVDPYVNLRSFYERASDTIGEEPYVTEIKNASQNPSQSEGELALYKLATEEGVAVDNINSADVYEATYRAITHSGGTSEISRKVYVRGIVENASAHNIVISKNNKLQFEDWDEFLQNYGKEIAFTGTVNLPEGGEALMLDQNNVEILTDINSIPFGNFENHENEVYEVQYKITDKEENYIDSYATGVFTITIHETIGLPPQIILPAQYDNERVVEDLVYVNNEKRTNNYLQALLDEAEIYDVDGQGTKYYEQPSGESKYGIVSKEITSIYRIDNDRSEKIYDSTDVITTDYLDSLIRNDMYNTIGQYKIIYTAIDGDSNKITAERIIYVAGQTKFVSQIGYDENNKHDPEKDVEVGTVDLRFNGRLEIATGVIAYHIDSDGKVHESPAFSQGDIDLSRVGAQAIKFTSTHHYATLPGTNGTPRPQDEITKTYYIHGGIQFSGLDTEILFVDDTLDLLDGVSALFGQATDDGVKDTKADITTKYTDNTLSVNEPQKVIVEYTATDNITGVVLGSTSTATREITFIGNPEILAKEQVVVKSNATNEEIREAIDATSEIDLVDEVISLTSTLEYDFSNIESGYVTLIQTYTIPNTDKSKTTTKNVTVIFATVPSIKADNVTLSVGDNFDAIESTNLVLENGYDESLTTEDIVVFHGINLEDGKLTTPGIYPIMYEVTDKYGNTYECSVNVTVIGRAIISEGSVNTRVGESIDISKYFTASYEYENEDGNLESTSTSVIVDSIKNINDETVEISNLNNTVGKYIASLTATNSLGTETTVEREIYVHGNITFNGNVSRTVFINSDIDCLEGVTATFDRVNQDGSIDVAEATISASSDINENNSIINVSEPTVITITYTAKDEITGVEFGNTQTTQCTIKFIGLPTIESINQIDVSTSMTTENVIDEIKNKSNSSIDLVDSTLDLSGDIEYEYVKASDSEAYDKVLLSVTYSIENSNLSKTTTHDVVVNYIPEIDGENLTFNVGDNVDEDVLLEGVTAYDKEDGNLSTEIIISENNIDTSKPGTYKVVYSVCDSAKASSSKEIMVKVNGLPFFTDSESQNYTDDASTMYLRADQINVNPYDNIKAYYYKAVDEFTNEELKQGMPTLTEIKNSAESSGTIDGEFSAYHFANIGNEDELVDNINEAGIYVLKYRAITPTNGESTIDRKVYVRGNIENVSAHSIAIKTEDINKISGWDEFVSTYKDRLEFSATVDVPKDDGAYETITLDHTSVTITTTWPGTFENGDTIRVDFKVIDHVEGYIDSVYTSNFIINVEDIHGEAPHIQLPMDYDNYRVIGDEVYVSKVSDDGTVTTTLYEENYLQALLDEVYIFDVSYDDNNELIKYPLSPVENGTENNSVGQRYGINSSWIKSIYSVNDAQIIYSHESEVDAKSVDEAIRSMYDTIGIYEVTYCAVDGDGNKIERIRTIHVASPNKFIASDVEPGQEGENYSLPSVSLLQNSGVETATGVIAYHYDSTGAIHYQPALALDDIDLSNPGVQTISFSTQHHYHIIPGTAGQERSHDKATKDYYIHGNLNFDPIDEKIFFMDVDKAEINLLNGVNAWFMKAVKPENEGDSSTVKTSSSSCSGDENCDVTVEANLDVNSLDLSNPQKVTVNYSANTDNVVSGNTATATGIVKFIGLPEIEAPDSIIVDANATEEDIIKTLELSNVVGKINLVDYENDITKDIKYTYDATNKKVNLELTYSLEDETNVNLYNSSNNSRTVYKSVDVNFIQITGNDVELSVGDSFDFITTPKIELIQGINDYEISDLDISSELDLDENNIVLSPGSYEIVYSINADYGTLTSKSIIVDVYGQAVINASDRAMYQGETIDLMEDVSAYYIGPDKEEVSIDKSSISYAITDANGDIVSSEDFGSEAGTYTVTYSASNKLGRVSTKTVKVIVNYKQVEINEIPTITASDLTFTVGDSITNDILLKDVKAFDTEDGDISDKVEVLESNVNTSKAGTYTVVYKVTDSQGASCTKTIVVNVKDKDLQVDDNNSSNSTNNTGNSNNSNTTESSSNETSVDENVNYVLISGSPDTSDQFRLDVYLSLFIVSCLMLFVLVKKIN